MGRTDQTSMLRARNRDQLRRTLGLVSLLRALLLLARGLLARALEVGLAGLSLGHFADERVLARLEVGLDVFFVGLHHLVHLAHVRLFRQLLFFRAEFRLRRERGGAGGGFLAVELGLLGVDRSLNFL